MLPTNCHQLFVTNQLSSTDCHQPLVTNLLPPTNCRQPMLSTDCHQPIVTNLRSYCHQLIATHQLSPTNLCLRRCDCSTLVFSRASDVPLLCLVKLSTRGVIRSYHFVACKGRQRCMVISGLRGAVLLLLLRICSLLRICEAPLNKVH